MRQLLRLPADSLLPGQTPAPKAACETLWSAVSSTPRFSSAMIAAARVQSHARDLLQQGQLCPIGLQLLLDASLQNRQIFFHRLYLETSRICRQHTPSDNQIVLSPTLVTQSGCPFNAFNSQIL